MKSTRPPGWCGSTAHTPDIITYNGGSVERLPGGHSIIQWGNDNTANPALAMTEADANGNLVCDVAPARRRGVTGRFHPQCSGPSKANYVTVMKRELHSGNTYVFNDGSTNTGVTLEVATLDADVYNSVTVSRQPFAPVLPRFMGKAPRVVPVRVQL